MENIKRRTFMKGLLGAALAPFVPASKAAKADRIKLVLGNSDKYTITPKKLVLSGKEGPFVQFGDIWLFSVDNTIECCHKDRLYSEEPEETMRIIGYDKFSFWHKEDGKLFWYGENTVFQILTLPLRNKFVCYL